MITTCAVFLNTSPAKFLRISVDRLSTINRNSSSTVNFFQVFEYIILADIFHREKHGLPHYSSNSLDFMTVSSPSLPEFRCKFTEFYRFLGIPRHCRSSYLRPCSPRVAFHTRFQPRIFPPESGSRSSPRKEGGGKLMDLVGSPP